MAISLLNFIGKAGSPETETARLQAWINNLPMANPPEAQAALIEKLTQLNGEVLEPATRIALLDTLYKPLVIVQTECAPRYVGKPLPLNPAESAILEANLRMRRLVVAGYALSVEDSLKDGRNLVTALQRNVAGLTALLGDSLRARVQPDAEFWKDLHGRIALAENRRLLTAPVSDPNRFKEKHTTTLAAYAEAILLYTASTHELSARQVHWMSRWARRWAGKLEISETAPTDSGCVPLKVDLESEQPPLHRAATGPGARFLTTSGLRQSIRTRLALLEKGKTPAELGLGDDCTQPACGTLLEHMYQRWCKGGMERRLERRSEDHPGRALAGRDAILHLFLGYPVSDLAPKPKPATVAQSSISSLMYERERLATFGSVESLAPPTIPQAEDRPSVPPPFEFEWRVLSESVTGLCMSRPLKQKGASRLTVGQLLAVEVPRSTAFLLSTIRWLNVSGDKLRVGVELHPSPVQAVVAHAADDPKTPCPLFLLPAAPGGDKPATIITPPGIFKTGRILVIPGQTERQIRLVRPVERGEDYEQLLYE